MRRILTVNYEEKPVYDILLEADFNRLTEAVRALDMANRKIMIITDSVIPVARDFVVELCNRSKDGVGV